MDSEIIMAEIQELSTESDESKALFYYVSDLHLEQQLQCMGSSSSAISKEIDRKVKELISSAEDTEAPLLIAGDVADGYELAIKFYKSLLSHWKGQIIAVLGNHELWNVYATENDSVDEIINKYKDFSIRNPRVQFLENELLFLNRYDKWEILSAQEISDLPPRKFDRFLYGTGIIVLGGIGFSGLNSVLNAESGLYQNKITREEEINKSSCFSAIHEKLRLLAGSRRIVVLSHTSPENWCSSRICPNWIYVCGHNHQNRLKIEQDGPYVLNDNQMGFEPRIWALKSFDFNLDHEYDSLKHLPDGIHEISTHDYLIFNRCRGIYIEGFKRQGTIYAIKSSGVYMFLFEGKNIYILKGGTPTLADHSMFYYQVNMPRYVSQIKKAFASYNRALHGISETIRSLEGNGNVHGCIVDIDGWNHIYLDPYDGSIRFYYATDITNKLFFADFQHLVRESPSLPNRERILKLLESGKYAGTKLITAKESDALIALPKLVLDRSMYSVSGKMRSVQYIMENNVIRLWSDSILNFDFDSENESEQTEKTLLF